MVGGKKRGKVLDGMFYNCTDLRAIPLIDTSTTESMAAMFYNCQSLTAIPELDTGKVTNMSSMFYDCRSLTAIPELDTGKVTNMNQMLYNCCNLTTIQMLDMRNIASVNGMVYNCQKLTDCSLRNIKSNLQVGFATNYGHLLTLDSLVHLIYELRNTGSMKTLTVGSANLKKLADVYVKFIDITDEMRAEDDLIDEKLPFVRCESTDEGAMLITDYVAEKKWQIQ